MTSTKVRVFRLDGTVLDVGNVEAMVLSDAAGSSDLPTWIADKRTLVLVTSNVIGFVTTPETTAVVVDR